uniref:Uncharacterized protein n=1 Tax=Anopheles minimus TaxID=112268 RepID=A0A182WNZ4_9DIPT
MFGHTGSSAVDEEAAPSSSCPIATVFWVVVLVSQNKGAHTTSIESCCVVCAAC